MKKISAKQILEQSRIPEKVVSFRLSTQMYEELKKAAASNQSSASLIVRSLIEGFLKDLKK